MASNKAKGAAVVAAVLAFTVGWEGTDLVAKRDPVGTGHPLTWCHGETSADDPTVKAGQRFTPAQCDAQLAKSLPKYLVPLQACIKVEMSPKTEGAFLDAAYNAGAGAVCNSPMVAKANAGDLKAACEAFSGWYVRGDGHVLKGLINRRNGEKQLCLEGLSEPVAKPEPQKPESFFTKFLNFLKGLHLWH